jgi:hypothetical protein
MGEDGEGQGSPRVWEERERTRESDYWLEMDLADGGAVS